MASLVLFFNNESVTDTALCVIVLLVWFFAYIITCKPVGTQLQILDLRSITSYVYLDLRNSSLYVIGGRSYTYDQ